MVASLRLILLEEPMKRIFVCVLFLTAFSTYANAQEDPIAEWFGGYSYSRINPDFLAEEANSHGFHSAHHSCIYGKAVFTGGVNAITS